MRDGFYVLFRSNTDAMMLDSLLRQANIPARISPTPHDLQKLAGCGVALLVDPQEIEKVRACIAEHDAPHFDIVRKAQPIDPRRDHFA